MNDLTIFQGSTLIEKNDFDYLLSIQEELQENFLTTQIFRSRYEAESIINDFKFPSDDAKYWQVQREQSVHWNELCQLFFEYQKNIVRLELIDAQIEELSINEKPTTKAKIKLKEIEKAQLQYILIQQQKIARERIREIRNWSEIKASLKLKYPKDSPEHHQAESYYYRHLNQLKALKYSVQEFKELPTDTAGFFNILGNFDKAQKVVENKNASEKQTES